VLVLLKFPEFRSLERLAALPGGAWLPSDGVVTNTTNPPFVFLKILQVQIFIFLCLMLCSIHNDHIYNNKPFVPLAFVAARVLEVL